jgi:hypothetical protein
MFSKPAQLESWQGVDDGLWTALAERSGDRALALPE